MRQSYLYKQSPYIGKIPWKVSQKNGQTETITFINSLAPGRCDSNFKSVISKHMLRINFMSTYCGNALSWMQQDTYDDKSTLV